MSLFPFLLCTGWLWFGFEKREKSICRREQMSRMWPQYLVVVVFGVHYNFTHFLPRGARATHTVPLPLALENAAQWFGPE